MVDEHIWKIVRTLVLYQRSLLYKGRAIFINNIAIEEIAGERVKWYDTSNIARDTKIIIIKRKGERWKNVNYEWVAMCQN